MADNSSDGGEVVLNQRNDRIIIVQILILIFLSTDLLLIVTFFKKECFHTTARYILFAVTLLSDSTFLLLSDILLLMTYFEFTIQVWLCIIICTVAFLNVIVTPVTLTAMTLERYVAICMPLRHAELCSTRRTLHCIHIIHGISSVPCIAVLSTFFASASRSMYRQYMICTVEIFVLKEWQSHIRSALQQFYFFIMCVIIIFCYVQIMKVAKAASGENKQSSSKGLKTVVLHAIQLLLCVIGLWCPFIEAAVLQVSVRLFIDVRYFNYIMFTLGPKCLSPLIYGLRDETFFHALKNNILFGLLKRNI
uniref:odorant receptor 131-2-like n=1 Tax=Scatophagus argus TaxID=75038 RepID=UPI001ED8175C|nr:odorant receptor 131-2-like [Scatophagus argus]